MQALRGVAALLVVLTHATLPNVGVESALAPTETPWLTPFRYVGISGVDLFFVISGFIMLVTNWESFGHRSAGLRFFVRRAIRIYPSYWFAMLPVLALLVATALHVVSTESTAKHIHVGGYINSILLLPNPDKFVLAVAWTLVWEMLFYVIFAAILSFDRRWILTALASWTLAEIGLYISCAHSNNFYLSFSSAPIPLEFIGGAFIGYLYLKRRLPAPRLFAALAAAGTVAAWSFVALAHVELGAGDIARVAIFGPAAMLTVYAAVALEAKGGFTAPRPFAAIGDGSYAIYLWHLSIIFGIREIVVHFRPAGPLAHAFIIGCTLAIVTIAGLAIFRIFEKPVTRCLNRAFLADRMQARVNSVTLAATVLPNAGSIDAGLRTVHDLR